MDLKFLLHELILTAILVSSSLPARASSSVSVTLVLSSLLLSPFATAFVATLAS